MAIVTLPGISVPNLLPNTGGYSFTGLTMDADGEKVAYIFQAPKTGSIRTIKWFTSAVTTATDTDCRLETVDLTTGAPSGTLFGANTNIVIAAASITANSEIVATLTADASVTKGDLLAFVIAPAPTPNFQARILNVSNVLRFPYVLTFTTVWIKSTSRAGMATVVYSDDTRALIPRLLTAVPSGLNTFINTGSDPDEIALKFTLPFGARVTGCQMDVDFDGDCELILYDSDGSTELANLALDKDTRATTTSGSNAYYLFPQSAVLVKDTVYYLAVKPTTTTNVSVPRLSVENIADWDQFGGDTNMYSSERVDGGTWTDDTLKRPAFALLIDGIDVPTGGGPTVLPATSQLNGVLQ